MKQLTPIEYERCYVAYRDFLAEALQTHNNDMRGTITWSENKIRDIYRRKSNDRAILTDARRYLKVEDVNKIMYELLMGCVVNGTQH